MTDEPVTAPVQAEEDGLAGGHHHLLMEEMARITRRVPLETEKRDVASPPQPRAGLEYAEHAYRTGLFDGSHWIGGDTGVTICERAAQVERHLLYPHKLREQLIEERAELRLVEARLAGEREDLAAIADRALKSEAMLQQAQEQRDQYLFAKSRHRIEQIQQAMDDASAGRGASEIEASQPIPPAPAALAQVFTGVGFILSWIALLFADLALSIGAIYALGFPDPIGGGTWDAVVTNLRRWTTEWMGLSVCFGITATTFFFKLLYEKIKHRRRDGLDPAMLYFLSGLCALAVISLAAFAVVRVEYLTTQMPVKVNPLLAQIATVTGSILFLVASAVCLSEGMQALSIGLWRLWPWRKDSDRDKEAEEQAMWQLPTELRTLLETAERERDELRTSLESARESVRRDEARKIELEDHTGMITERLESIRQAFLDLPAIDRDLYRLGRQHGARARRSEGAFRVIEDLLGADIAGSTT